MAEKAVGDLAMVIELLVGSILALVAGVLMMLLVLASCTSVLREMRRELVLVRELHGRFLVRGCEGRDGAV